MSRIFTASLVLAAFLVISALPAQAFFGLFSSGKSLTLADGKALIPLDGLKTGEARFFTVPLDGKTIKLFALKTSDGRVRTAFDACDVCWHAHKGYAQDGDFMVCVYCGMRFHVMRVGDVSGGCNPAPLPATVEGENVVITEAALRSGAGFF